MDATRKIAGSLVSMRRDEGGGGWRLPVKTSTFQKLTAARKPKVVITYKIIGIQGLIRLAMRRPRGRVYGEDTDEDRVDTDVEDGQLEAMGQGAGENGG